MSPIRPTPLMADVARRAGVSTMTVSRVINNKSNVTAETRERVEAAIAALGYRANVAARTLAGGRSRVLGAISVQPESWGPSRTVFGIEAAARASGHLVSFTTAHDPSISGMRAAIDSLRSAHVEGIVVVARLTAAVKALQSIDAGIPIVVTYPTDLVPYAVGIDQEVGARIATRHLIELGHQEVSHIRGPKGWIDADGRAKGWRKELRATGRAAGHCITGDWTPSSGYEAGLTLAADRSVTAVFVANDQMALGVLRAMNEAGRSVPGDVSVVGFDDVPEAGFYIPPLTTVRQDFDELGRESVESLLALADGGSAIARTMTPELIVRSSTAPRRSGR